MSTRSGRERLAVAVHVAGRLDRAGYRLVGRWHAPRLDRPLRGVARAADRSKPWLLVAGLLAVTGGARGRRAAAAGVTAIGLTSLLVNQPLKALGARRRPDRAGLRVPSRRWVPMPASTSFPSGHAASAAAFAVAVGRRLPGVRWPLRAAAVVVGFSRVYTGVHYPSDVLAGAAAGTVVGRLVTRSGPGPARTG
ncbi:MAG TPA: phosphatase PAP2 family protein [Jatrophihabitans sp.]|nr:phosphatase PAP2 family protein [Jatrophihabitans sp.]